ncbi:MAG TPA: hypothetical protein VN634_19860 [Candidatus Limnocylindrales bacterium]|nr:hypothetical protein [Candidatus Limnocylindrales bacterium]
MALLRRVVLGLLTVVAIALGAVLVASVVGLPRYSYLPAMESVLNPQVLDVAVTYDTSGRSLTDIDAPPAADLAPLPAREGDVRIDSAMLALGRETFYRETFGNEVFLTDVAGFLDGPLRPYNLARAVMALEGRGTTNLRVELAETVRIGSVTYREGSTIDTGLDVPAGSYAILGMPIRIARGHVMAGMTCAACHSTVDPDTKQVIDGAVNSDLAAGLLLAFATNSAAYFPHAEVASLEPYVRDRSRRVAAFDGSAVPLPDASALEAAVDEVFASWPPGSFDTTTDMKADPTQIPDSFTLGDHPYGWSGYAAVGPFLGLASLCNNAHGPNADSLAQADLAPALFGIDSEVYIATILQNAANPGFRFDPEQQERPSAFVASVDPTPGAPGINELVKPPGYPEISWIAPDGMFVGSPGRNAWEQSNAMAAWQNTLAPPPSPVEADAEKFARGRVVFEKARCAGCHAGPALTSNKIIAASQIETEPARALAYQKTEASFGPPLMFTFDTPVPLPAEPKTMLVNMKGLEPHQLDLAWAHDNTTGGYKIPSLVGLYWSAPYLHDGGVAVGANDELGVSGTLLRGVAVSPEKSLIAFVDRNLRELVVAANDGSASLRRVHVRGSGHPFWADTQAGFSADDQRALVHYLLTAGQPEQDEDEITDSPGSEVMALAWVSDDDRPQQRSAIRSRHSVVPGSRK